MKPVALQANKALYSEQFKAISNRMQTLVSAEVLNESEAESLTNSIFDMYMNPYNTVENGSVYQKMVGINTISSGGIDDLGTWADQAIGGLKSTYGQAGGDSFTGSLLYNKWGVPINNRNINLDKYEDYVNLKDKVIGSDVDIDEAYNDKVANADDYNTATQKWDNWMTNITKDLSDIANWIGKPLLDIAGVIVSGITTYIGAKVIAGTIGKSLGLLGGTAGGGTGAGIIATGGGVAMGAFASAAGIVLSTLIANGISKANAKNMGKNVDYYNTTGEFNQFNKTDSNGNTIAPSSEAKELLSYGLDKAGSKGWGGALTESLNVIGEYKSNPLMGWGVSRKDRNQAIWEKELNLIGAKNLSAKDTAKAELAWLMIADATGVINEIDGWSSEKIKAAFSSIYDSDEDASNWVNQIQKWGTFYNPQISTSVGKTTTYVTPKDFKNYHRQGLDEVPYDNYIASLHEGEAVLTASTANELRNLLDEYRSTSKSSADLDVIIQQQTNALCTKLDDVIGAITRLNFSGGKTTTSSLDQAKAQNILRQSMLHMTNTKNALN